MQRSVVAAVAIAVLVGTGTAVRAADDEKPLPVERNGILANGVTYVVEGRVRIPKGVTITLQKDTKLVGRKDAVLEVDGELEVHGVGAAHVPIQDVTIELHPKCAGIHVDMVDLAGTTKITTAKDQPTDCEIILENVEFKDKAGLDVEMNGNTVLLRRVRAPNLVRVKGVDKEGAVGNKVRFIASFCNPGKQPAGATAGRLMGGVVVENVSEAVIHACNLLGDKVSLKDCDVVAFDENYVGCKTLEFVQTETGRFAKTTILKCDFQCDSLVASAPFVEGRTEKLVVDRCWFDGGTAPTAVRDRYVKDRSRDPKCGVMVEIKKLEDAPLGLAGGAKK